jgi:hypothetical protein
MANPVKQAKRLDCGYALGTARHLKPDSHLDREDVPRELSLLPPIAPRRALR